jgi:hypothetical protein
MMYRARRPAGRSNGNNGAVTTLRRPPAAPPTQRQQIQDPKNAYSSGFEAAKAIFAPERWHDAKDNLERLAWLALIPGVTLHEPVVMPNTISESKSWLIVDAFGDELGKGATLIGAIDDGRARFPRGSQ